MQRKQKNDVYPIPIQNTLPSIRTFRRHALFTNTTMFSIIQQHKNEDLSMNIHETF